MSHGTRFCRFCGAHLITVARYCEVCGKPVQETQFERPESQVGIAPSPGGSKNDQFRWKRVLWFAGGALGTACLLSLIIAGLLWSGILPAAPLIQLQPASTNTASPSATSTSTQVVPTMTGDATQTALSMLPTSTSTATATQSIPSDTPVLATINIQTELPVNEIPPTEEVFTFPDDRVFLVDDFSDRYLNWATETTGGSYVDYHEGQTFVIAISTPGFLAFSYPQVEYPYLLSDVVVSVSGNMVEGSGYWGIRCRYIDQDNFYMVAIADGYYMIAKSVAGQYEILTEPDWIYYEDLELHNYEDGFVPITVNCIGDTIDLRVGDFSVGDLIVDNTHQVGYYDIFARSGDVPGEWEGYYIKMLFDNFGMYVP